MAAEEKLGVSPVQAGSGYDPKWDEVKFSDLNDPDVLAGFIESDIAKGIIAHAQANNFVGPGKRYSTDEDAVMAFVEFHIEHGSKIEKVVAQDRKKEKQHRALKSKAKDQSPQEILKQHKDAGVVPEYTNSDFEAKEEVKKLDARIDGVMRIMPVATGGSEKFVDSAAKYNYSSIKPVLAGIVKISRDGIKKNVLRGLLVDSSDPDVFEAESVDVDAKMREIVRKNLCPSLDEKSDQALICRVEEEQGGRVKILIDGTEADFIGYRKINDSIEVFFKDPLDQVNPSAIFDKATGEFRDIKILHTSKVMLDREDGSTGGLVKDKLRADKNSRLAKQEGMKEAQVELTGPDGKPVFVNVKPLMMDRLSSLDSKIVDGEYTISEYLYDVFQTHTDLRSLRDDPGRKINESERGIVVVPKLRSLEGLQLANEIQASAEGSFSTEKVFVIPIMEHPQAVYNAPQFLAALRDADRHAGFELGWIDEDAYERALNNSCGTLKPDSGNIPYKRSILLLQYSSSDIDSVHSSTGMNVRFRSTQAASRQCASDILGENGDVPPAAGFWEAVPQGGAGVRLLLVTDEELEARNTRKMKFEQMSSEEKREQFERDVTHMCNANNYVFKASELEGARAELDPRLKQETRQIVQCIAGYFPGESGSGAIETIVGQESTMVDAAVVARNAANIFSWSEFLGETAAMQYLEEALGEFRSTMKISPIEEESVRGYYKTVLKWGERSKEGINEARVLLNHFHAVCVAKKQAQLSVEKGESGVSALGRRQQEATPATSDGLSGSKHVPTAAGTEVGLGEAIKPQSSKSDEVVSKGLRREGFYSSGRRPGSQGVDEVGAEDDLHRQVSYGVKSSM